jgi:hypothetical protein
LSEAGSIIRNLLPAVVASILRERDGRHCRVLAAVVVDVERMQPLALKGPNTPNSPNSNASTSCDRLESRLRKLRRACGMLSPLPQPGQAYFR